MKRFEELTALFSQYLTGSGFKKYTVKQHADFTGRFLDFMKEKGIENIADVKEEDISGFQSMLSASVTRYEKPYSPATLRIILLCLKRFFRFLLRMETILVNPMESYPVINKGLENRRAIFSRDEMDEFLSSMGTDTVHGQRDRAYFELMYSSGLRIGEELNLNLADMDLSARILTVRQGKGGKDRTVPFSVVALAFLKKYLEDGRKTLLKGKRGDNGKVLFLSAQGRMTGNLVRIRFRKYLEKAGIKRKGLTVHSIRHTTATHLLEAGAGVRYVQELLGHESIETTVKYTHLMMENLKKAYKSAHPRENKYYEEVTGEYLENIRKLKEEIEERRRVNERYPPEKYNVNRKK